MVTFTLFGVERGPKGIKMINIHGSCMILFLLLLYIFSFFFTLKMKEIWTLTSFSFPINPSFFFWQGMRFSNKSLIELFPSLIGSCTWWVTPSWVRSHLRLEQIQSQSAIYVLSSFTFQQVYVLLKPKIYAHQQLDSSSSLH